MSQHPYVRDAIGLVTRATNALPRDVSLDAPHEIGVIRLIFKYRTLALMPICASSKILLRLPDFFLHQQKTPLLYAGSNYRTGNRLYAKGTNS